MSARNGAEDPISTKSYATKESEQAIEKEIAYISFIRQE